MARIPYASADPADGAVKEHLDWVASVEGQVPNHFLLELHFAEHFKAWLQWVRVLWDGGELSFREIQQIGIAVSAANGCPYCTGSFCSVLQHGGGEDRARVERYLASGAELLEGRERTLVDFALKANSDPHGTSDQDIARLRGAGLSERGIVQLVWVVNVFASVNRLNTVLDTDFDALNPYQLLAAEEDRA